MRHGDKVKKLGRKRAHRIALLRNLVSALIRHERIRTTLVNAKQTAALAERLISYARQGTLAARRQTARILIDKALVKKLFQEIAPRFDKPDQKKHHQGGYTRIYRLGPRHGDGAELALLELVVRREVAEGKESKSKAAKK
ncbi:MAG: 50S ribosomal protein L17 [candidate division WOR-3 bacterium]